MADMNYDNPTDWNHSSSLVTMIDCLEMKAGEKEQLDVNVKSETDFGYVDFATASSYACPSPCTSSPAQLPPLCGQQHSLSEIVISRSLLCSLWRTVYWGLTVPQPYTHI